MANKEDNQLERARRGSTSSGEDWSKYITAATISILLLIGTASAGYSADLKEKSQLEVIEYWLAEQPHSAKGSYELMVATDAFTSKGYKKDTISGDYQELRIWVAKHSTDIKIVRNNMVKIND